MTSAAPEEATVLRELEGTIGFRVLAVDTESWRLEPRVVTNAFATGRKPVFKRHIDPDHVVTPAPLVDYLITNG